MKQRVKEKLRKFAKLSWFLVRSIPKRPLNLGITFIVLFSIILLYLLPLRSQFPGRVLGASTTYNQPTNTAFNASGASGTSVEISNTEVKLAADSDWWHTGFPYKRTVTITNTQATAIAAGTTVTLTMDTKQFVDAGKMQTDGDDLRIAYKNAAND